MKRVQSGRTRQQYMQMISEYKKRMAKYPKGHVVRKNLSQRISKMKWQIEKIRKKNMVYTQVRGSFRELPKIIFDANEAVFRFFGKDMRMCRIAAKRGQRLDIEHKCFCKYLLENGCRSRDISFFMASSNKDMATGARTAFNKSFAVNPENKKTYHQYKRLADTYKKEKP